MYLEIRDLADPDERSQTKTMFRLEDESDDQTGSEEIEDFVSALSDAYGKFYAWDVIVSQAELDSLENGHSRESPIQQLTSYGASVPAEDELRIEKTHTSSPVVIELTGAPGPLKKLQSYFANRHVDWDREKKEPSEDRRLELEQQRTDAVRKQVDLLHGLGFPEIQIREALSEYIFGPLDRLERYADIKLSVAQERQRTDRSAGQPEDGDER
jgi:hypothetical protein